VCGGVWSAISKHFPVHLKCGTNSNSSYFSTRSAFPTFPTKPCAVRPRHPLHSPIVRPPRPLLALTALVANNIYTKKCATLLQKDRKILQLRKVQQFSVVDRKEKIRATRSRQKLRKRIPAVPSFVLEQQLATFCA